MFTIGSCIHHLNKMVHNFIVISYMSYKVFFMENAHCIIQLCLTMFKCSNQYISLFLGKRCLKCLLLLEVTMSIHNCKNTQTIFCRWSNIYKMYRHCDSTIVTLNLYLCYNKQSPIIALSCLAFHVQNLANVSF